MKLCLALISLPMLLMVSCVPCQDPQGASMDRKIDMSGRIGLCFFGDSGTPAPQPSAKGEIAEEQEQAEIPVVEAES